MGSRGISCPTQPEQIVAKWREAQRLQGQGATIPQVCKKLGCAEQTFYRWRGMYGSMKEDEAIRLKTLEQENARLKRSAVEDSPRPRTPYRAEKALPAAGSREARVPGPR